MAQTLKWGPYHSLSRDPLGLTLKVEGEKILKCELELGWIHKGLEKAMVQSPWSSTLVYAGHLDPEGAFFGEWLTCQAIENILKLQISERAVRIRKMMGALTLVSLSYHSFSKVAMALEFETLLHFLLRDREQVLDLFELIAGARFQLHFCKVGGVAADVSEGFLERVLGLCRKIRERIPEYRALLVENPLFLSRAEGVGRVSQQLLQEVAPEIAFPHVFNAQPFDCATRVQFRFQRMVQALHTLEEACEWFPQGPFRIPLKTPFWELLETGEGRAFLEGTRGRLELHLQVEKGRFGPQYVKFQTPTELFLKVLPSILVNTYLEDLPLILASFDLSLSEADR